MRILTSDVSTLANRLLATLPQADWNAMRSEARRAYVPRGQSLLARGSPVDQVCFVESGLVSLLAGIGGRSVQVAMVGREGLVGESAFLGQATSFTDAVMQFPGFVVTLPAAQLLGRLDQVPAFRALCMEHLRDVVAQLVEAAVCAAQDTVLQRCARWLLAADARIDGEELPVTHEMLALLLGVRRPGITLAMAVMDGQGLVQTRRGTVRLLDRPGMTALATEGGERGSAYRAVSNGSVPRRSATV